MKKVLLLINTISENPSGDELDVLVQAEAVEAALDELGWSHTRAYCGLNLQETLNLLEKVSPDKVFNLVETLGGKGSLIHLPAALLESSGIPFTGSPGYALYVTTDKVRTKRILKQHHLPTPGWILPMEKQRPDPQKKYILKPVWEDGSAGITDASVTDGTTLRNSGFPDKVKDNRYFLEEYIDGREFNITLLAGPNGPEVMPVAEMLYLDYPEGKPKILNFASKWEPASFEYEKTVRSFETSTRDRDLVVRMGEISLKCWEIFELRGYARVDFRVDPLNQPYVLEVNANPCISPDAGFVAACAEGGVSYTRMIERILMDVNVSGWKTLY